VVVLVFKYIKPIAGVNFALVHLSGPDRRGSCQSVSECPLTCLHFAALDCVQAKRFLSSVASPQCGQGSFGNYFYRGHTPLVSGFVLPLLIQCLRWAKCRLATLWFLMCLRSSTLAYQRHNMSDFSAWFCALVPLPSTGQIHLLFLSLLLAPPLACYHCSCV